MTPLDVTTTSEEEVRNHASKEMTHIYRMPDETLSGRRFLRRLCAGITTEVQAQARTPQKIMYGVALRTRSDRDEEHLQSRRNSWNGVQTWSSRIIIYGRANRFACGSQKQTGPPQSCKQ